MGASAELVMWIKRGYLTAWIGHRRMTESWDLAMLWFSAKL